MQQHSDSDVEMGETADGLWVAASSGRGRLTRIGASVVRIDIDGHAYADFARIMTSAMDELALRQGALYIGIDAEGMESYDARFRYLWTEWIKANETRIDGLLILFRSRVVQSVVVIINAVTGEDLVEACGDREQFEQRLATAAEAAGASAKADTHDPS